MKQAQNNLFEWLNRKSAPRGILDISGVKDIDRDAAKRLHADLEEKIGCVDLILTDNRRRMVSIKGRRGRHELRLHHMFLGSTPEVIQALAGLSKGHAASKDTIRLYIRENSNEIREAKEESLEASGHVWDLSEILERIRPLVEDAPQDVRITWGKDGRGKRSIRLGSYEFESRTIRIHPALDAKWVPDFFLEFVVYHELLHAVFPPVPTSGRRVLHPPEFREREALFPRYEEAMVWEKANINRLLSR